jgi:hypothetical protein
VLFFLIEFGQGAGHPVHYEWLTFSIGRPSDQIRACRVLGVGTRTAGWRREKCRYVEAMRFSTVRSKDGYNQLAGNHVVKTRRITGEGV